MKIINIGFLVDDSANPEAFAEELRLCLLEGKIHDAFVHYANFAIMNIEVTGVEEDL